MDTMIKLVESVANPEWTPNPENLKEQWGIRFHHFLDRHTGQLVGTICTMPSGTKDVLVSAVSVHSSDRPGSSRARGRMEALKRLVAFTEVHAETKCAKIMEHVDLAKAIRNRTILRELNPAFPGPRRLRPVQVFVQPSLVSRVRRAVRRIMRRLSEG